ncbi:hypothetical protein ACGFNU_39245 [Spirillospora sp. NPDC048911]|uniref:hypothetical protein n=1 Tax=Spirillospora sp. NPDC048911 TaxID=3364527 RepID=UPI003718BBB1
MSSDGADQVDPLFGQDVGGSGDLVAGGGQGDGEAGSVGVGAGGVGGVADGDA